ncbi:MAG: peroxiredoxin [Legionellales bacterium]|nr:peroxiredoxin [Legionellales bacterium]
MSVLVSRKAPNFTAAAVLADGQIENNYQFYDKTKGKYTVLFFYPLDFTFVCPTELIALDRSIAEFQQRGAEVLTVSIDSQFTHAAWRNTAISKGGIGPVAYTMLADTSHEICRIYGVEHFEENVALRATFIIDQNKVVRSQTVNDLPIGRNVAETLRTLDSLQHFEQHGEVCPMDWQKGSQAMQPNASGVASWLSEKYEEENA